MNALDERQMGVHVRIAGWLLIAGNAFFLLIGLFVLLLLVGVGIAVQDPQASPILLVVGVGVGGFLAVLGVPGIVAGAGLLARQGWARILAIVVAILSLPNFPLGTVLGAYVLYVLLQDAAPGYFAQR